MVIKAEFDILTRYTHTHTHTHTHTYIYHIHTFILDNIYMYSSSNFFMRTGRDKIY